MLMLQSVEGEEEAFKIVAVLINLMLLRKHKKMQGAICLLWLVLLSECASICMPGCLSRREGTVLLHSLWLPVGDGGQIVNAWLQRVYQARRRRNLLRNALWRLQKLQVLYVIQWC